MTLAPESLPPGYTISGESTRTTEARPDRPQTVTFEVRALRSIAGSAPGAAEVRIDPLGRIARTWAGVRATGHVEDVLATLHQAQAEAAERA